ncbi:hypothetical protein FA15DRAFT_709304 [Coprinopsis marcescibilis]|uniref:Uncharacterized protein n=1 Tax=Coprinopsis marcescibilis TaxID=230819 RepID=A0A5C3KGY6_COPMA|nr:hypothetical protein FA15DRAFT_709304 [Coprinopsis marcescibilis]
MPGSDDIESTISFDKTLWVGIGKKWPENVTDVPVGLAWFRDEQLLFPDFVNNSFNEIRNKSVEEFLRLEFPAVTYSITCEELTGSDEYQASRVNSLRCAAIAISADEESQILSLPEYDVDELDDIFAEDSQYIANSIASALPAPQLLDEAPGAASVDPLSTDLSQLVSLREAHQTKQAQEGVRTSVRPCLNDESQTEKQKIIRELNAIVRENRETAIGTGAVRALHWTSATPTAPAGNAANAAAVSTAAASRALTIRRTAVKAAGLPQIVEDAGVSKVNPLRTAAAGKASGYAFALHENEIVLVKVLQLHSRSGGKAGKLGYVPSHDNIAGVTNVYCQVLEHTHGRDFCIRPTEGERLLNPPALFALLLSPHILHVLHTAPHELGNHDLSITNDDSRCFSILKTMLPAVRGFVAGLTKKKRGAAAGAGGDGDDAED